MNKFNLVFPKKNFLEARVEFYSCTQCINNNLCNKINQKECKNVKFNIDNLTGLFQKTSVEDIIINQELSYTFFIPEYHLKLICKMKNGQLYALSCEKILSERDSYAYNIRQTNFHILSPNDERHAKRKNSFLIFLQKSIEAELVNEYLRKNNEINKKVEKTIDLFININKLKNIILSQWINGNVSYEILNNNTIRTNVSLNTLLNVLNINKKDIELSFYPNNNKKLTRIIKKDGYKNCFISFTESLAEWPENGKLFVEIGNIEKEINGLKQKIRDTIRKLEKIKSSDKAVKLLYHLFYESDVGLIETQNKHETTIKCDKIKLDDNQRKFIQISINTPDYGVCYGDPGTGKTTVLSILCDTLVKDEKKCLVVSKINANVDQLLIYAKNFCSTLRPLRLIHENKKIDSLLKDFTISNPSDTFLVSIINPLERNLSSIKKQNSFYNLQKLWLNSLKEKKSKVPMWYIQFFNSVFSSVDYSKQFLLNKSSLLPIELAIFDYIIVDNADTVSIQDIILLSNIGKHIIFAGDTNQRIPHQDELFLKYIAASFINQKRINKTLIIDLYNKYKLNKEPLVQNRVLLSQVRKIKSKDFSSFYILHHLLEKGRNDRRLILLKNNYRNKYLSILLNEKSERQLKNKIHPMKLNHFHQSKFDIRFFDTRKILHIQEISSGDKISSSKKNKGEANVIIKILKEHLNVMSSVKTIAVVNPYRSQVDEVLIPLFNKEFKNVTNLEKNLNLRPQYEFREYLITPETFDSFSNQECDLLILTFTIQKPEDLTSFLLEEGRIYNVLSRAKYGLWVIGNDELIVQILKRLPKNSKGYIALRNIFYFINIKGKIELPHNYI